MLIAKAFTKSQLTIKKAYYPMSKRSIIPYYFFMFFAVIIAMNVTLAYLAITTWTGLETKNTYIKSPKFNTILQERQRIIDLGWSFSINAKAISDTKVKIKALILDKNNAPIEGFVRASLLRPTHHGSDKTITLAYKDGLYMGISPLPLKGQWDISITMQAYGETVSTSKRFFFK